MSRKRRPLPTGTILFLTHKDGMKERPLPEQWWLFNSTLGTYVEYTKVSENQYLAKVPATGEIWTEPERPVAECGAPTQRGFRPLVPEWHDPEYLGLAEVGNRKEYDD